MIVFPLLTRHKSSHILQNDIRSQTSPLVTKVKFKSAGFSVARQMYTFCSLFWIFVSVLCLCGYLTQFHAQPIPHRSHDPNEWSRYVFSRKNSKTTVLRYPRSLFLSVACFLSISVLSPFFAVCLINTLYSCTLDIAHLVYVDQKAVRSLFSVSPKQPFFVNVDPELLLSLRALAAQYEKRVSTMKTRGSSQKTVTQDNSMDGWQFLCLQRSKIEDNLKEDLRNPLPSYARSAHMSALIDDIFIRWTHVSLVCLSFCIAMSFQAHTDPVVHLSWTLQLSKHCPQTGSWTAFCLSTTSSISRSRGATIGRLVIWLRTSAATWHQQLISASLRRRPKCK